MDVRVRGGATRAGDSRRPVTTKAATAVIAKPVGSLPKPIAGQAFSVGFVLTRSDTGGPLTTGTTTATASIGGKLVPVRLVRKAGNARVSLAMPKKARGKKLVVRVDVSAGGSTTTRRYTATVS